MDFQLQTMMTTYCNLNCDYCYMRVKDNPHRTPMTLETFQKAVEYLPTLMKHMHLPNYISTTNYHVAFFGGEPLLELDAMIDITKWIRTINKNAMCHFPTNGLLLTEENLKKINDNDIAYSLSYDGPYGDLRGVTITDTFLSAMKQIGTKAMVSPFNVKFLMDNLMFFINQNILYPDFTLVRDDVWTEESLKTLEEQLCLVDEFTEKYYKENKFVITIGLYWLYIMDTIINTKMRQRMFSCFSGVSGVAIWGDGTIYPCARFGSNNKFYIGNFLTKEINQENIDFLYEVMKMQDNQYCKKCKLYGICNMGCHYSQLMNGNWEENKPVESVCKALRICYKHAINHYTKYKTDKNFYNYLKQSLNR